MQAIEIKSDVMVYICQKAEREGRTITDVLDEMLRTTFLKNCEEDDSIYTCHSCRNPVDYDINGKEGYCDFCESVVFIEKAQSYP